MFNNLKPSSIGMRKFLRFALYAIVAYIILKVVITTLSLMLSFAVLIMISIFVAGIILLAIRR